MTEPKVSFEESTKMSLDEYISKTGIVDDSKKVRKRNRNRIVQPIESMDQSDYDPSIPNASSQQWRLMDPNRPIGQPPLISSKAKQKSYFNGNRNGGNNYRNNHRRQYKNSYADRDIPSNYNGINRNHQPNFKSALRPNSIFGTVMGAHTNGVSTALMPLMPLMPNDNTTIATMNNLAGMVAPILANGDYMNLFNMMMEKWDENRQIKNRPKYDMKAQKEIAQIQGKPFIYTCSSGAPQSVPVSSDGPGIEDCPVTATTTDTSLNQRFTKI